jgi:hypothetical protein
MKRPRLTYANVMASLSLFVAIGGTASAAVVLTGVNVKDNTITGADVKDGTLTIAKISPAMKAAFKGAPGDKGFGGMRGSSGLQGGSGSQGPRGSYAYMTSAYAFRDTGLTKDLAANTATPNPGDDAWDDPNYAAAYGTMPNIRALGTYNNIALDATWKPVLAYTGMSGSDVTKSADTLLKVTFAGGYLQADATLSLLHRNDGEDLATNDPTSGTLRNGRVSCAVFYGTSLSPGSVVTPVGPPAMASSGDNGVSHELVQLSLVGNAGTVASPIPTATNYNVVVKCRDVDFTGNTQWQVASGNLTAFVSR